VNDILVAVNNVEVALHHIHALICAMAHSKDTLKHFQETGVGAGEGGGTTATGSASMSHIWKRRNVMTSWTFQNCRAKRLMCRILIEPLICHHLDHAHNIRRESTRSLRVDSNIPYLIDDVVKSIKVLILHYSMKQVPLIGLYGI
jgi:hypothetical protein